MRCWGEDPERRKEKERERESELERGTGARRPSRGAGSMALAALSLWVLTSLTWTDLLQVAANRHSVYWNSSNIQ